MVTRPSIVARSGWIIPAPFAIPPTVKPDVVTAACFGCVSVVMIAAAAAPPPSSDSPATAGFSPGRSLSIGSWTPITPVDRTSTCSAGSPSNRPASAAVANAFSLPRSPVAEFATPELTMTACGSARATCSRFTWSGAA